MENATRLFAEIQSAYQVLSDSQERAWYDTHREAILRDVDIGSNEHFEHNVRLTSAAELVKLIGKFTTSIPFTDAPNGFYGSLRTTFDSLAKEEYAACDWEGLERMEYPDFGTAKDSYEHMVKPFYAAWTSFTTKKTFSWKDVHNYAGAPDRRIRRLMEKENKRLREEGIKEFNDAVRSLVSFVRKRDPRYAPNVQSEADRQKALRDAAAAQAARSRALHQAKLNEHVQPAWTQTHHTEEEGRFSESEESEEEEFECVTCNKVFKSEKQYEAHERSKKHIKAVQQLIRQMQKENKLFDLDHKLDEPALDPHSSSTENDVDGLPDARAEVGKDISVEDAQNKSTSMSTALSSNPEISPEDIISEKVGNTRSSSEIICEEEMPEDSDDEYAPRDVVEERIFALGNSDRNLPTWNEPIQSNIYKLTTNLDTISLSSDGDLDGAQKEPPKKLGKAKAKRAKKAAREVTIGSAQTVSKNLSCNRSS